MIKGLLRSFALIPVIETVREQAEDLYVTVEHRIEESIDRAQRKMMRAATAGALAATAGGLALASVIVFLSRFFPVDAVLLGTALVIGYIALLVRWKR